MTAAIAVRGLRKHYGATVAVDDVNFDVEEGEILGIVGPNGAGKTTTVECLQGLRSRDAGTVEVLGLDPARDRAAVRQRVGTQLQSSRLQDRLTVAEAVALYASFYDRPADPGELLEAVGLVDAYGTRFAKLSGGQQQRLSIALALAGTPEVAVFDEITTGLDPRARRDTWELIARIRARGVTVLLVTHSMEEAQHLCDRVAVIADGRLLALDTPTGLIDAARGPARVHIRSAEPLAPAVLLELPLEGEVAAVDDTNGAAIVGTGDDLVPRLMRRLLHHGVPVTELRLEQPTLDDAYLALTDQRPEESL